MTVKDEIPTIEEFIELASANKVQLIERLAAKMLTSGYELAAAAFDHYRLQATAKGTPEAAIAQAKRAQLDWEYDALKHSVSALQSTLKAERVGMLEHD